MSKRLCSVLAPLLLILLFIGCSKGQERPFGFLRLGKISDFKQTELWLPHLRLLVRHDQNGFSVMSTDCTYDLTPLQQLRVANRFIFKSKYSDSSYSAEGKVLNGPTQQDLPYYRLVLNSTTLGGPLDTLYAVIGERVDPNWRLNPKTGREVGFFSDLVS